MNSLWWALEGIPQTLLSRGACGGVTCVKIFTRPEPFCTCSCCNRTWLLEHTHACASHILSQECQQDGGIIHCSRTVPGARVCPNSSWSILYSHSVLGIPCSHPVFTLNVKDWAKSAYLVYKISDLRNHRSSELLTNLAKFFHRSGSSLVIPASCQQPLIPPVQL